MAVIVRRSCRRRLVLAGLPEIDDRGFRPPTGARRRTSGRLSRLLGPPVVGLARGLAPDGVDERELARHLVPGDRPAAVLAELVERGRRPGTGRHDGRDALGE